MRNVEFGMRNGREKAEVRIERIIWGIISPASGFLSFRTPNSAFRIKKNRSPVARRAASILP
jgi:hypothetical protein